MVTIGPRYRAVATGAVVAALLAGAYALGASHSGTPAALASTTAASQPAGRITVTGTGTVTGTPNQLVVSMGVQVSAGSVSSALDQADQAVTGVTAALRAHGVAAANIQTSGLSISPDYRSGSQQPVGYQVTESLTATLDQISLAGSQIQAAVGAGGNAVTVDGVSLNLTEDGPLLAAARASAVADARTRAGQFARAAGEPLGRVLSITQAASTSPPVFGANSPVATGSVPVSPGSQQVSVSVTVVFAA